MVEAARFASAFTFQYSIRAGTRRPRCPIRSRRPSCRSGTSASSRCRTASVRGEPASGGPAGRVARRGRGGGKNDATHRLSGRAEDSRLVHFEVPAGSEVPRPGDVVTVTITEAASFHLIADAPGGEPLRVRRTRAETPGIELRPIPAVCRRRPPRRSQAASRSACPACASGTDRRRDHLSHLRPERRRTPVTGFLAVVGATGTGKSALSLELATALRESGRPAEIVNADAMQFYRGMDIGTAKLPWRSGAGSRTPLRRPGRLGGGVRRLVPADGSCGDRRAHRAWGDPDPRRRFRAVRLERHP